MRRTKAAAEETRSSILAAAERVFYAKGVSTATLEDVATAAGVTRGAIYWHFANKTDLFLELYKSVPMPQEDMIMRGIESTKDDADILAYIEASAGDWLDAMTGDEQRQRLFSILLRCDYSGDLQPVLEKQQEMDDRHTRMLEAAFERLKENGKLDHAWTPQSATRTLRWMMKGLFSEWLLFGRRFDLATEGREALRRLFGSFRKPEAPKPPG